MLLRSVFSGIVCQPSEADSCCRSAVGGYAVFLLLGNGYAMDESNWLCIIDRALLGAGHLYQKSPIDPEGLFSTLPAIAHTLIGFACGRLIIETKELEQKVIRLFVVGFLLFAGGYLFTEAFPLNKRIWSPTFVLVTCGLAAMLQAVLMYFIDMLGRQRWCRCFEVFGVNPLFLYVLSEMAAVVVSADRFQTLSLQCTPFGYQQSLFGFRLLFATLCFGDGGSRLSVVQEENIY